MPVTPSSTVVGVFRSRSASDQAIEALYNAGIERAQMRYIASNTSGGFFEDLKNFFTGASTNTSPTEGDVSNPLAALGFPRETAQYYSDEYNKGNPVLVVNAPGREQEALSILKYYGAYNTQMKSVDNVQPPMNVPQQDTDGTPASQDNAQNWPSSTQPQMAKETPFEDQQQDTEPFHAIKLSPTLTPSYDPALDYARADESAPGNPAYSVTSFSENRTVADTPQPDVSISSKDEETPVSHAEMDIPEQDVDKSDEEETVVPQVAIDTPAYSLDEESTSETQMDTSEQGVEEIDAEETPVQERSNEEETLGSPIDMDTPEQVVEETPTAQEDTSTLEQDVEETSVPQVDIGTPAYSLAEKEVPVVQTGMGTSEQNVDEIAAEETPVAQDNIYTHEYYQEAEEMPAVQTDIYPPAQTAADSATQKADVQPLSQTTASEDAEELEQLQDQIKIAQQQLQDARAKLETTKERESQYRKRQKQLQNARKQLQNLQEELQATQTELQETEMRVASYQYPGMEDHLNKSEKPKKPKKFKI